MNARDPHTRVEFGLSAEAYFAADGVSNSLLSAMRRSPRHAWALYIDPNRPLPAEPTAGMRLGTLTHTAILEPDKLDRYVIKPPWHDGRTTAGKAWVAANAGRDIADAADLARAQAMRRAVLAVPELEHALQVGHAEVSIFWRDERAGLPCKARIDFLRPLADSRVIALDLKTCPDSGPAEFGRSVWNYGYYRQAAHYSNGLAAVGMDVAAFLFAAVCGDYPHIAVPYLLDEEATRRGADEVRDLLDQYAECQRTGQWPAYGDGVQVLSLPAWAK
jgi:hypothetical protein